MCASMPHTVAVDSDKIFTTKERGGTSPTGKEEDADSVITAQSSQLNLAVDMDEDNRFVERRHYR